MAKIEQLQQRLGLVFTTPGLLETALVHRSYLNEHPLSDLHSNERLEFLGDSVINFLAARFLFQRMPEASEGQLTALRSGLVKTSTLAGFARRFGLGQHIRMAKGEASGGGRERDALLADAFEALLAAIYLDQGIEAAGAFAAPLLEQELGQLLSHGGPLDHKSRLQEVVQAARAITPRYRTVNASGPDHRREFTVEVWADEELLGVGVGQSKQSAAQAAALAALEKFGI
jgi:ribonuclease III